MGSSPAGRRGPALTVIVSRDRALGELLAQTVRLSGLEVAATAGAVEAAAELRTPVDLALLDEHAAAAVLAEAVLLVAATTIVFRTTPAPPGEIGRLLQRFDAYVAADEHELLAWLVARVVHARYRPTARPSECC